MLKMIIRKFLTKYKLRFKYTGIIISPSVIFINYGNFQYGKNCIFYKECSVDISGSLVLGDDVIIRKDTDIDAYKIRIGNDVSIQKHSYISGEVSIGSYCIFAPNVFISSGRHEFRRVPTLNIRDQDSLEKNKYEFESISIGEDCWLGINVVVLPGVRIGKGCIVGANSVVTQSLPPYSIAVGTPARVISKRLTFDPPVEIWPCDDHVPYFYEGFLTRVNDRNSGTIKLSKPSFTVSLNIENVKFVKLQIEGSSSIFSGIKKFQIKDELVSINISDLLVNDSFIDFSCDAQNWKSVRIKKIWTE